MRVHELGKELNVDSKAIIGFLKTKGHEGIAAVSTIPENLIRETRDHFRPSDASQKKTDAPKAAPLPDYIVKKVEAEAKAAEEKEAKTQVKSTPADSKPKIEKEQKKKKIIAVFNPQHARSDKARAMAKQHDEKAAFKDAAKRPAAQKQTGFRDSASEKDAKPTKRLLPSQLRPARDRIPDDELQEMKLEKERERERALELEKEKAREEELARARALEKAAEEARIKEEQAEKQAKIQETVPVQKVTAPVQKEAAPVQKEAAPVQKGAPVQPKEKVKPERKESEAVKSLREKIVKGTVNVNDIQLSKRTGPANQGKKEKGAPSQGKNRGQEIEGRKGRGDNAQHGSDRSQGRDNQKTQKKSAAGNAAPVMSDSRGKGKGGRPQKGKYEKQGSDKFDRFENEKAMQKSRQESKEAVQEIKVITIPDTITLKELADKLKMQPSALIKKLFLQGKVYTVNDVLDFETAESIALDMDIICEHEEVIDYIEELLHEDEEDPAKMVKRPPVVCVMGHVDHGKTSLLDAIRNTNVIAKEAGGITQHIGAYQVTLPGGEKITFLDTPGHEAFTAMRLRGAMATDVAILVVAADDGVMPQTIEAINHAKAAGIHVIVAINKIDKPGANIDKVKQELSDQGLVPEEWGGDVIFCPVSAKKGQGIEELLEMVILDTEILELRANPDRKARGLVIEAKLDKGRGCVVTLLVQKGTLKVGDHVAMGESYGKVRSMTNADGVRVKEAGPSVPVEITGLNGVPNAGEVFVAYDTDKEAKAFAQVFIEENKKKLLAGTKSKMNLEDVFDQMKAGEMKDLEIIIKADVQGSVGALKESLEKLSNDEVNVKVIHAGVGNVNESDAILASASNAIIIAFNVTADAMARDVIEREKVDLRKYNVIYSAIDDVELAIKGMLKPVFEEVITGHAEIRQIFRSSSTGSIAGSYITDGVAKRDSKVRLTRNGEQIYEGAIATLKRFSDDVKEVRAGYECGITLKDYQDFREGDIMECYEMKEVPRK